MGKMGLPPLPPPSSLHAPLHTTPQYAHTERDSYCATVLWQSHVAGTAGNRIYVRLVQNGIFFLCKTLRAEKVCLLS